jgi:midasin (ATPase involved in ribosome maturation)
LADRYAPANVEKRPSVDIKIAFFENQQLQQGQNVPVVANELHGTHLEIHVPVLNQMIESLNTGEADPMQVLPMLQSFYQHISETAQFAAGDPALEGLVSQTKQVLQFAEEAINNTMKAVQKMQREQMEQQGVEGEQAEAVQENSKMQEHQVKMQIAQEKAELDMAIKQKKHEQEMAIRDAKAALEFRENSLNNA